ncbi:MAG: prepilin-type N-terminal cleavage/methylation domain-containing protein [Desulfobacteraceae bacterium]|nr:prepilin-type N-terminal cleavage/methylation domain-containing protein [Desulfobacteraceae bacterium]
MQSRQNLSYSNQGFTMIELLVAMVVALLALGAIYSTFLNQQKSYVVQGETAAMHQNIRAAMFYMQREIRMAGCDPNGSAGAAIITAGATSINFTEDVIGNTPGSDSDGATDDPDENITYALDANKNLVRTDPVNPPVVPPALPVPQTVAQNIDAIDFVYLDGASPPNVLNPGGIDVPAGNEGQIRSVEITIVARTDRNTLASKNNNAYFNQRGMQILAPQDDNFSRQRLTTSIKCRNLGL